MGEVPVLMPQLAQAAAPAPTGTSLPPLVVDLDGTLLRTDVTAESVFVLVKRDPRALLSLPWALLRGRAVFKRALAQRAQPDVDTLPLNEPLLEFLRHERHRGRALILATGADQLVAHRIAARLGLFDSVFASDGRTNMTGDAKRGRLVAAFGERGFDYVGNSRRDLPVWAAARRALVAGGATHHLHAVRQVGSVDRVFADKAVAPGRQLATWLEQLRWRHWIKNALVLVPIVLAHRLGDMSAVAAAVLATLAFCAAASSIYLINDLIDLPSDRRHPRKRERPLASGRLPILRAIAAIPLLWGAASLCALFLPPACGALIVLYVAAMLAYSLRLKDLRYVDAAVLAGGYTLRAWVGTWAIGLAVDPWLAAWCLPTFFGLALLKRRAELAAWATHPGAAHGRAYRPADARPLAAIGRSATSLGAAALAVLPLAHGDSPTAIAGLWLAALLLAVGTRRLWRCAAEGRIEDDPVAFAMRDPPSRALGLSAAALLAVLA